MSGHYSQEDVDELAEDLQSKSSELSQLILIDYQLPPQAPTFLTADLDYEKIAEEVHSKLEEADRFLDSVEPIDEEDREEHLYRMYRKHGKTPEIPFKGSWRDFYSEEEVIDNERDSDFDSPDSDRIDYRSLLRAHNYAALTLINAAEYDKSLEDYLPDIEGDDAEIIEETEGELKEEVQSTPVLEHQKEGLGLEDSDLDDYVIFSFLGTSESDEETEDQ